MRTYHAIVTVTQNARNLNKNHVRLRPTQQKLPWIAHRQHCLSQPSRDDTTGKTSSLATFNSIHGFDLGHGTNAQKKRDLLSYCFHTSSTRVFWRAHLECPWPGAALSIKSTRQSMHLMALPALPISWHGQNVYLLLVCMRHSNKDFSAPAKARFRCDNCRESESSCHSDNFRIYKNQNNEIKI